MSNPTLTFLNHACFMVRTDSALLLADPWLDGTVLNDAWSLVDRTTSSAAVIAALNGCGLPVFIWCSRAAPDRLSLPFLQRFQAEFRGIATFLHRQGRDWRLADELRRQRFALAPCKDGQPVALGKDLRLTAFANGEADSWCLIQAGRRSILHLGERALGTRAACRGAAERLRRRAPRIDVLLTGFANMAWSGNPDGDAQREEAAGQGMARLAMQADAFRPRLLVPVASFARFARADNAWLNHGRRSPAGLLDAPRLETLRPLIRFMAPYDRIDLEQDSPASLAAQSEAAVARWMACWRESPPPLPRPPEASVTELRGAFQKYRDRACAGLYGLPRLLEAVGALRPLAIHLADLRQTVELSYRHGFRLLARDGPADVALCSGTALWLLKAGDGYDTVYAGGCFWTLRPGGLPAFARFFLPQRMTGRGLDRRRPLAMARLMLRTVFARMARQARVTLR
ncbi:hypothetical protein [Massilia sp. DD77]|uniref:hypothetical protein n=1 Tax=Massilia sp. DD77 TaxID=3109349 RepID=UPI002FFDDC94